MKIPRSKTERCELARTLGSNPSDESIVALLRLASDRSSDVRYSALEALAGVDVGIARLAACGLLSDPDTLVRMTSVRVLRDNPKRLFEKRLIEALQDRNYVVRADAALGLGQIATPTAKRALVKAMRADLDEMVRRDAAIALGETGDQSLAGTIEEALHGENDELSQIGMLFAIYALGNPVALDRLLKMMSDPDSLVRYNVVNVLDPEMIRSEDSSKIISALGGMIARESDPGLVEDAHKALSSIDQGTSEPRW